MRHLQVAGSDLAAESVGQLLPLLPGEGERLRARPKTRRFRKAHASGVRSPDIQTTAAIPPGEAIANRRSEIA